MRALIAATLGALTLGFASAFGDWLWANFLTDGALVPAVVHGVLVFLLIAAVLGCSAGVAGADVRVACRRLVATLPLAGLLIAAVFYPVASVVGYLGALLVSWCAMWVVIALLFRWSCGNREAVARTLLRSGLAAVLSGAGFWAISGIWTTAQDQPINYVVRSALWAFAFLPGFAALLLGHATTD